MSFQEMNKNNSIVQEGRPCIILCNFSDKELKAIQNVASIFGAKDQIIVNHKNGDSIIKDIIDGNASDTCENGLKDKAVIFNAISQNKMSLLIDNIKKLKFPNPLMSVVTETSINWELNVLLENLKEERAALKKGKNIKH